MGYVAQGTVNKLGTEIRIIGGIRWGMWLAGMCWGGWGKSENIMYFSGRIKCIPERNVTSLPLPSFKMTKTNMLAELAREKAKEICDQLTLDEKVELIGGRDIARMNGIERLNIPSLKTSDGPSGIRGAQTGLEFVVGFPFFQHNPGKPIGSAVFPCATALAATWDKDCVKDVAKAIARDGSNKNVNIALAPTINIIRDPRGGRSFECLSEDPFLTAQIGAAWTYGCQDLGKMLVCLKHFCGNECETERHRSNTIVDQITLREVYMRPFEMIIKTLRKNGCLEPASIMMGYNQLNGVPCSTNSFLIKDVLRQQWDYKGLTMSDWFGTANGEESVKAGLDIEMPGPPVKRRKEGILQAIQEKKLNENQISKLAYNVISMAILAKLLATNDSAQPGPQSFTNNQIKDGKDEEHAASEKEQSGFEDLLTSSAASSCVLLKNTKQCLPMQPNQVKNVVIIGEPTITPILTGGGSAKMPAYDSISAFDSIQEVLKGKANVRYFSGGFKLSTLINPPSEEQLQNQTITLTWHKMKRDTNSETFKIDDEPYYTEDRRTTELRNWFGGMQSPESHFAIRTSFNLQPTRKGCHTISLQAFGQLDVKIFENDDEKKQIAHWLHNGESSGPEFMFHPHKLLEKYSLHTKEGQSVKVMLEYRMPIKQVGPVPEKGGAFRLGIEEEPLLPRQEELQQAIEAAKSADVVLLFTGTGSEYESEGIDRQDIDLPDEQDKMVEDIASAISPDKTKIIVINTSGSAVSMPWAEHENIQSILQSWFGGQRGGKAIADVLFGKSQPLGRLPMTWPKSIKDHSSFGHFPCKKDGKGFTISYEEKTLIGHRWYEAKKIKPLFWFGFGLSYSTVEISAIKTKFEMGKDGSAQVFATVQNLSEEYIAKHIIQLYHLNGTGVSSERARSLVGFSKTDIEPRGIENIKIEVHKEALAKWNVNLNEWILEKGTYAICIASSSSPNDEYCRTTINVTETSHWV